MVQFAFGGSMPTLVMAQRLYADASRADELRDENKVVHPAFMLPTGMALSS
jgi:prophage DNA circulation protein